MAEGDNQVSKLHVVERLKYLCQHPNKARDHLVAHCASSWGQVDPNHAAVRRICAPLDQATCLQTPEHLRDGGLGDVAALGQLASHQGALLVEGAERVELPSAHTRYLGGCIIGVSDALGSQSGNVTHRRESLRCLTK